MKNRKVLKLMALCTLILFLSNCGGGNNSITSNSVNNNDTQNSSLDQNDSQSISKQNGEQNGTNNSNQEIVSAYEKMGDTLIETRSDGTKRAWVNSKTNACLIYRIADRGGNIADGGKAHCESLNQQSYEGITNWRMPNTKEASYLMKNVPKDKIIYPDNNPNCLYMATSDSKESKGSKFVYTTKYSSNIGGIFSDTNRRVAGVRCVADR